jgi:hypothetical protein
MAVLTPLIGGGVLLTLLLVGQLVARWWWAGFARLYEDSWMDEPAPAPRFTRRRRV